MMVARSDSIVAFGRSRWTSAMATPGIVYRPMTPAPMTSFGIAYRRDDGSLQLAYLLEIVDEVATAMGSQSPDGGELIAR